MKALIDLMNDELRKINISKREGFSSLEEFITKDFKCREFMRIILSDEKFDIPNEKSTLYYISKGRASHSIINYLFGRILTPFANIYSEIGFILGNYSECNIEYIWLLTALYHDIGYLQKDITNELLDYQKNINSICIQTIMRI